MLKIHLTLCRSCKNFTRQLEFLRKASRHARICQEFRLTDTEKKRIDDILKSK